MAQAASNEGSARVRLRDALGALREALGAVSNLEQLLRSPKVAPKAIAPVLPDLEASCEPLQAQLAEAIELLKQYVDAAALEELSAFLVNELGELRDALRGSRSKKRQLTTAARLRLERSTARAERSLAGVLPLLEVMNEAVFTSPGELDVLELLRTLRDRDQPSTPQSHSVELGIDPSSVSTVLSASPRGVLTWIGLATGVANQAGHERVLSVCFQVLEGNQRAVTRLLLSPATKGERHFRAVVPPIVKPTRRCVEALSQVLGVELSFAAGTLRLERNVPQEQSP